MARLEGGFEQRRNGRWPLELRPPTALECRSCGEVCDVDAETGQLFYGGIPDPCPRCGGRIFLVLHVLSGRLPA